MTQRPSVVPMRGGLDLVTPHMQKRPGSLIGVSNYESEARGYRRMLGYERFDGQPKPSEAAFWKMAFTDGATAIAEGDTITGATTGHQAIALRNAVVESGTWAGGDAAGYVFVYNATGVFQNNENLEVSAATVAVADGTALERDADTDTLARTLVKEAAAKRRTLIAALPGSGPVRGVFTYKGDVYAVRDNAGATAGVMHKATASGWVAQSFGRTLDFTSGGTTAIVEGDTIKGATSGATATVERIVKLTGTWSGGDAAGYMVLSGQTGTFQAENLDNTTAATVDTATIAGDSVAITLPAGGKYRAEVYNFFAASNLVRAYVVNGVGRAFEWDGTVMAPIRTGLSDALDKPKFVGVHNNHLLLGYDGGAVLISGTGLPLSYLAADGAAEVNLGSDLTGLVSATKTATIIAGRNKIAYLTGFDVADFQFQDIAEDSGAVADTMQSVGEPYFLDDIGVRSLQAADTFGDWQVGTVTSLIEPYLTQKRRTGTAVVGAMRVRGRTQYRLFYADGEGVNIYFGRQTPECMIFTLGFTPVCLHSGDDADGFEQLYAGDDAGMVYQLDKGTSQDGATIEAYMRLTYLHQGAPTQHKRYHRAFIDVESGQDGTNLFYVADFGYGDDEYPSGVEQSVSLPGGGGFWDVANWDQFTWSAPIQSQAIAALDGVGPSVSLAVMSDADDEEPHTIASVTINYSPRRMMR